MSKIYADTIKAEGSNVDITLGAAGDAVLIPSGATLKTNKIADAGGNNIFTSDGSGSVTVPANTFGGAFNLLTTNTFTGAASSNFTTLIDSTYDVYIFSWNAVNPATNQAYFTFQCSTDGGSNYNTTLTSELLRAYHSHADTYGYGQIDADRQAQGTSYQKIQRLIGSAADECTAGNLFLFKPSSTTYVKNWYSTSNGQESGGTSQYIQTSGYYNTTSAINAVSFAMSSGNMDGQIKMYGISKS